jgi:hypothetical protein
VCPTLATTIASMSFSRALHCTAFITLSSFVKLAVVDANVSRTCFFKSPLLLPGWRLIIHRLLGQTTAFLTDKATPLQIVLYVSSRERVVDIPLRTMGIVSFAVRRRWLEILFETTWQIRLSVKTSQRPCASIKIESRNHLLTFEIK